MNDELVDCFNCGRSNPEWAQVCRSCGVPLRHGEPLLAPTGRIPTDRDSLVSIGAVIGTILLAVVLGLIVSGLNPTDPTVGRTTPTPSPSPTPEASESTLPSETPAPTPTPVAALPGILVFGTALDENKRIVEPVNTFTPGMIFAHSIEVPTPFGVSTVGEQIVRILEDGTEEEVVRAIDNQPQVQPDATVAGFAAGDATNFIEEWGPGLYVMRVYAADVLIAQEQFTLAEG
ncbi:MAG: hypothetical protein ACXWWQ_02945 [Candidatus Limnocylindria bacterium]